jgi:dsRNA-specific ribonuclease
MVLSRADPIEHARQQNDAAGACAAYRRQQLTYRVLDAAGPDHDKTFTVEVCVNGAPAGRGTGHSKKEAEQQAACAALRRLEG